MVDDYKDESGCEDESENVGHVHDGSDDVVHCNLVCFFSSLAFVSSCLSV